MISLKALVLEGRRLDYITQQIAVLEKELAALETRPNDFKQTQLELELGKLRREKSNWEGVYAAVNEKSLLLEGLSKRDAEQVFSRYGIHNASTLSKDNLKSAYRNLVLTFHPDKNPPDKKESSDLAMRWINGAYDVLKMSTSSAHGPDTRRDWSDDESESRRQRADYQRRQDYRQQQHDAQFKNSTDGWAQAGWSGGLPNNSDGWDEPGNINYYKKKAWEISGKPPFTRDNEYTFSNWDGYHFRGGFTVYAIPATLFEISKMMISWDDSYQNVGIFFYKRSDPSNKIYLINLRGKEVSPPREFEHQSFNKNAGNDKDFVNMLRKTL